MTFYCSNQRVTGRDNTNIYASINVGGCCEPPVHSVFVKRSDYDSVFIYTIACYCYRNAIAIIVEYYDDNPLQLGLRSSYEKFLEGIKTILSECYRVLKQNKYCIWNINDFRMDGKYYMYHADIARIMQEVGFKLWDIVIIPWKSSIGACFADQVWSRKITAKKHEYLVCGKKI